MADDELVGNMDSELMIAYFKEQEKLNNLNDAALTKSLALATALFI